MSADPETVVMVDDRKGSGEVAPVLRGLKVPVVVQRLESADFAFEGQGPKGTCLVGVERKRVGELLQSIQSGRFEGEQLPKMMREYDQHIWLIVEGVWRPNPQTGVLEEGLRGGWRELRMGAGGFAFCQLDNFLTSMQARVHLKVKYANTVEDTAWIVKGMWQWYRKPWGQHKSGLVIYTPPPPAALFFKPNLVRRWAKELNGIGWEKSAAVAAKFPTAIDMVVAPVQEWVTIPGIGRGLALGATRQILGQEKE